MQCVMTYCSSNGRTTGAPGAPEEWLSQITPVCGIVAFLADVSHDEKTLPPDRTKGSHRRVRNRSHVVGHHLFLERINPQFSDREDIIREPLRYVEPTKISRNMGQEHTRRGHERHLHLKQILAGLPEKRLVPL
jgi:hypothetical protein